MSSEDKQSEAGIDGAEFSRLFPYFVRVDKTLTIQDAGPGWKKFRSLKGEQLFDHFELLRPKLIEPDLGALIEKEEDSLSLALKGKNLPFHCELLPRRREAILVMTAEAEKAEAFKDAGLTPRDFAIHDQTLALMGRVISQAGHLENARELTRKLKESRDQLVEAKQAAELAQEAAERGAEVKQQFLAAMSHELRTPLSGMLGMAELLRDTDLDLEQERLLGALSNSGDSLVSIINDILDYSSMEIGTLDLEQRNFDPRRMLEGVADLLAPAASKKGLEFAAWAEPSVPQVIRGDETRLKQILFNLVNNAVKYTSEGHITVRLSFDGEFLRGSVQDTGDGITPDAMPGLFDAFAFPDAKTQRKALGTGLGLTITKRLCEAMGGEIHCKTAVGKGTVFDFKLRFEKLVSYEPICLDWEGPVAIVVEDGLTRRSWLMALDELDAHVYAYDSVDDLPDEPWHAVLIPMGAELPAGVPREKIYLVSNLVDAASARRQAADLGGSFTLPCKPSCLREEWGYESRTVQKAEVGQHLPPGTRVLLVEDNQVNRAVTRAFLEKMGAEVVEACDGRGALEVLEQDSFEWILMACQMHGLDGYGTTEVLRKRYGDSPTVIGMAAGTTQADRDHCAAAGMNDYLTKPISFQDLSERLTGWVRNRQDRQAG